MLDLTDVTFLGSPGLRALFDSAAEAVHHRGHRPLRVIVDHTRPVVRPIEILGLDNVQLHRRARRRRIVDRHHHHPAQPARPATGLSAQRRAASKAVTSFAGAFSRQASSISSTSRSRSIRSRSTRIEPYPS